MGMIQENPKQRVSVTYMANFSFFQLSNSKAGTQPTTSCGTTPQVSPSPAKAAEEHNLKKKRSCTPLCNGPKPDITGCQAETLTLQLPALQLTLRSSSQRPGRPIHPAIQAVRRETTSHCPSVEHSAPLFLI